MNTPSRTGSWQSTALTLFLMLAAALACSNPLSRFTKQYKCQIAGEAEPRTAYEYVERGSEHIRADQIDCALGACSEAIRLDSKLSTAYACRGGIFIHNGEYLEALKDFDRALSLQPENGDFYFSRAQVHDKMKSNDLALADLAKAVELIRSELGRSMAYALRAKIYQSEGKLDEALKDYTDAITLAPDFAYHHDNRGNIYFENQQYQKAIADYSEAIKLDPKSANFHTDRAKAYRAVAQPDLASEDEAVAERLSSDTSISQDATDPSNHSAISSGDLTNKAISLPKPPYPPIARAARASGAVVVQVLVNEEGRVVSAEAISGHPLLKAAAVSAARQARFEPRKVSGEAVKVTGTITYRFEQ